MSSDAHKSMIHVTQTVPSANCLAHFMAPICAMKNDKIKWKYQSAILFTAFTDSVSSIDRHISAVKMVNNAEKGGSKYERDCHRLKMTLFVSDVQFYFWFSSKWKIPSIFRCDAFDEEGFHWIYLNGNYLMGISNCQSRVTKAPLLYLFAKSLCFFLYWNAQTYDFHHKYAIRSEKVRNKTVSYKNIWAIIISATAYASLIRRTTNWRQRIKNNDNWDLYMLFTSRQKADINPIFCRSRYLLMYGSKKKNTTTKHKSFRFMWLRAWKCNHYHVSVFVFDEWSKRNQSKWKKKQKTSLG